MNGAPRSGLIRAFIGDVIGVVSLAWLVWCGFLVAAVLGG